MTIYGVSASGSPALQGLGGRFFLPGAAEFADTLTVGQIIKGRVLRQYEGGRYLVNFDGHERVVDSAIPMKTGELLHGRVIGVGERVELQRVPATGQAGDEALPATDGPVSVTPTGTPVDSLEAMLARYRVELGPDDRATLARAMRGAGDSDAMAMTGVLLNKLGLAQSPELLNAAYAVLQSRRMPAAEHNPLDLTPLLGVAAGWGAAPAGTLVARLEDALRQTLERTGSHPATEGEGEAASADAQPQIGVTGGDDLRQAGAESGDAGRGSAAPFGELLLNVQTQGSVGHRVGTLPLLLGNRLVEVEVALFEQRRDAEQKPDARHRHLVFRLNTETLGQVEISARLAGGRVRVRVAAQDEAATANLASHAEALRAALAESGWTVDEVAYETHAPTDASGVVHAVVEHVVRQDSLNRLA